MENAPFKTRGGLETLEFLGSPEDFTIVLLHGYGANAHDLAPLKDELEVPDSWNWYFPNAPERLVIEESTFDSRMWFQIQQAEITKDIGDKLHGRLQKTVDSKLVPFLKDLKVPPEKLILGGFSQGSMMALDWLIRHAKAPIGGLLLFSATQTPEKIPAALKGQRFFQSHGKGDPILPYGAAKALSERLNEADFFGDFIEFQGGHTIPPLALKRCGDFLRSL